MKTQTKFNMTLASLLAASLSPAVFATEPRTTDIGTIDQATTERVHPAKPANSHYANRNFPTRPLFGDTHLHTSFSMDAGAFGGRLSSRDAKRFGHKPLPGTAMTLQERAYTSPIWYTP